MMATKDTDKKCPVCQGKGKIRLIEKGNVELKLCQRCRGTGQAGQYSTK